MKLTQEELAEIDRIKAKKLGSECDTFEDLNYCLQLLDKLRPQSRERFTYEWRDCENCTGGHVESGGNVILCPMCKGIGQVKTKVRSKAHNA